MKKIGIELIVEERWRQIAEEGWTPEHDNEHVNGELIGLAMCYLTDPETRDEEFGEFEPPIWFPDDWDIVWWKPTPNNRIRELQKAGALIAAEIDRLQNIKTDD